MIPGSAYECTDSRACVCHWDWCPSINLIVVVGFLKEVGDLGTIKLNNKGRR